jgi:hypothetical protein
MKIGLLYAVSALTEDAYVGDDGRFSHTKSASKPESQFN